jgi:hypothetical protein
MGRTGMSTKRTSLLLICLLVGAIVAAVVF